MVIPSVALCLGSKLGAMTGDGIVSILLPAFTLPAVIGIIAKIERRPSIGITAS